MAERQRVELGMDDRVRAEDSLYLQLSHTDEGKIKWIAGGIAVVLHIIVLVAQFPEVQTIAPEKKTDAIIVTRYVPPPPKVKQREVVKQKITRKVPIPDPTPDEPEPIREPEPDIEPEPLPPDVDFLIGVPEAPPPSGPLLAGAGGVTNPVIIEETRVKPIYPELARVARLEGSVILQAVIRKDGTVGDANVLRCNRPNMGFEDAAKAAVQKWRYKPALQGDRPVDVYFTIVVDFELQ